MVAEQPRRFPDLLPTSLPLAIRREGWSFRRSVQLPRGHAGAIAARVAVASPQRWEMLAGYRNRLLALAARSGAEAEAEDVAQEALLRAAASERMDSDRVWPYLATTAVNLVRDHYRRAARDRRLSDHAALLPRQRSFADDVAIADEAQQAIKGLVESEPTETVLMAWRCYVEDATWREVAAEFGKNSSAAEAQVRRAFLRVRRRFANRRDDSGTG